jgi:hypothetical protein
MLRRSLSAALVVLVVSGFVFAESYQGLITEISKDSVTIVVGRKKGEKGTEKKFKVSKDVKISKKTKDDTTEASISDITTMIEKAKGKVKGVPAKVETEGEGEKETVTKISLGFGGRKKKDK